MTDSPLAAHASSPAELKERIEASREGTAFLVYRDGQGRQRIHPLAGTDSRATVGRVATADVTIDWDDHVSRLHAILERVGEDWTVADDGLSRNGTFRNGERVSGHHRLRDGDLLRFGQTAAVFCHAQDDSWCETAIHEVAVDVRVSPAQRRVLAALCRPYKDSTPYAVAATNQQIAEQEFLSVDVVKTHLRTLYRAFGIEELPQNRKRTRLVELAFQTGMIRDRDL